MSQVQDKVDPAVRQRAINAIRALTIDGAEAAGSGHPGMPMGCADAGYALYVDIMKHNPKNPKWLDRDRYVQSAGHGSMLQYSLLHLTGYDLPMDELKRYRMLDSKTPGHPEYGYTEGVEITTGPLGQGIATSVGMALAERHLAAIYNKPGHEIVDHYTYVIAGDGCLMEGVSGEASSLAGHLGLGKLIVLYDDNSITIDGETDITFTEDVMKRYDAYGWHTQVVEDGNDVDAILKALEAAKAASDKPSIISVKTTIGFGSPNMAGTSGVHGAVLGADEAKLTKENLKIDWPEFTVPEDVAEVYSKVVTRGEEAEAEWNKRFEAYKAEFPELAAEFENVMSGEITQDVESLLPTFKVGDKAVATRVASGKIINELAKGIPQIVGGSADLGKSNNTKLEGIPYMTKDDYSGRNIAYGVREHGMAAVANGLSLHGGLKPYVATFLIFADYLRPALRLGALMHQGVVYPLTHDSIGLGGDGPTHQPIAVLTSLRAIPNVTVIRPADANETAQAWAFALKHNTGPTVFALSRQNLPILDVPAGSVEKGAYIQDDADGTPDVVLIGTGSEVPLCIEAKKKLEEDGIKARVVSMPSQELFEKQDDSYKESVLPAGIPRVAVEAGATVGWYKYVGFEGAVVGIDRFGESAEGDELFERFGFTVDNVASVAKGIVKK